INPNGRRGSKAVEWPHAADPVPRILFVRRLALAFVAFQEPWHEEFLRERRQLDATCLSIFNQLARIVEVYDFDNRAWLRRVVRNLVVVVWAGWRARRQPHERVA